jgi:hypothetical protein
MIKVFWGVKTCRLLSGYRHLQDCSVFIFRVKHAKKGELPDMDDEDIIIPQNISDCLQIIVM